MTNQEVIDMLEGLKTELAQAIDARIGSLSPEQAAPRNTGGSDWVLPDQPLRGTWTETGRTQNEQYRWPDGVVEQYADVVRFRGAGDFAGMELALGYNRNGGVAGLVQNQDGALVRAPTYFFPADDAATTHEKVSMIKGGGARGRSGFGPNDPIPSVYSEFKTDMLRNRIATKWNRLAIVAYGDDHDTMLTHTAIQAKARGL